jgi:hypothetical protein
MHPPPCPEKCHIGGILVVEGKKRWKALDAASDFFSHCSLRSHLSSNTLYQTPLYHYIPLPQVSKSVLSYILTLYLHSHRTLIMMIL